jgi:succinyl-diaminopimelate desuccinylase
MKEHERPMPGKTVRRFVMGDMKVQKPRLVRTLQDLVRIPSHESCDEISRYVASEIRKLGINPSVDRDGNIIARVGTGQALLLNAHMDTVGVKGYGDAFSGEVRGDRLYGRGSTDDKSGVAAMLELMKILKENPPKKQVTFAFTVGEEGGDEYTDGAFRVVRRVRATHGLVLESSMHEDGRADISIGCKGRIVASIEVPGKAIHSSRPQMGINPIYKSARLIDALKQLEAPSLQTPLGRESSTAAVTQIEAREGSNVIPSRCTLTLDYRAVPGEGHAAIKRRIEAACRKALGKSFRLSFMESKQGFIQEDRRFRRMCIDSAREAGLKASEQIMSGWIDAHVFNKAGIITLNMGPGTLGQAHMNPEYCWLPGLVKGTQAVLNIIRGWDAQ